MKNSKQIPHEFIATHTDAFAGGEFYAMVLYESKNILIWMDEDLLIFDERGSRKINIFNVSWSPLDE